MHPQQEPTTTFDNVRLTSLFKTVVIVLLLCNLMCSIILYSELQELTAVNNQQNAKIKELEDTVANNTKRIDNIEDGLAKKQKSHSSSSDDEKQFSDTLYFAECLHGGLLLTGNGSWLQYSTYTIFDRLFAALDDYETYKVTLELEPSMLQNYDEYYLARIRDFIQRGKIEIALTGYNQEFLGNFTYDYAFYSLNMSLTTIQTYLNYTPKVFLAQEQAFRVDTPKLLNKLGIKYALGKVNMFYWGHLKYKSPHSDLVEWEYKEGDKVYKITMIPDHEVLFNISDEKVNSLIEQQHADRIHHPFMSIVEDLEIWHNASGCSKNERVFPLFRSNDERFQYVLVSEYIEHIAYKADRTIEIEQDDIILKLPDKHNYTNWEGIKLNKTQFETIITKTHELEEKWLDLKRACVSKDVVEELFEKVSRLSFHDIWVCYNYCFGMCDTEGFENWFAYWLFYYNETVDYLHLEGYVL